MLNKTYDPAEIEGRIYQAEVESGAFLANQRPEAESYSIVLPPPNVTGSLHMGHALNHSLQDVLCRFQRMQGKDVLWQPGMDHAGIATQMVVERQLAEKKQPDRRSLGREGFIAKVWEWKNQSGGMILNQDKRLGMSCDWSRERFTMDEGLSKAVLKTFVKLYEDGLIYRDKRLVNWDPKFQTAISDLEVENRETQGHMWHFAYPLKDGEVDGISEIVIATTRPETMLGDGAVAVHPSDERYQKLIGKMVRLPIAERYIPIIADEYPDPEFGSGAVKITGAHDFNDFEVARRNNIPLIPLMDTEANMICTPENNVPERYQGVDRFKARDMVVAEIKEMGLLRAIEDKVISQPFGDRSGVVIEPMLTDQWYVDAATLAKPAIEAVETGKTEFVPKNWEKTYFEWMRNIQPWCISRQLWWGHQIPAWYGPDGTCFVAETEQEASQKAASHYGEQVEVTRDPDVLDTWFSSALWPYSTLGWPEDDADVKRFYPTSVLVTGFDIIFFWVARMMMMGLYFQKEVPFKTVYVHALVRDEHGAKMSKSKGNVIDPIDLVEKYGADAVRFTLIAMAAQGRDIRLSESRVEGYRNFGTKIWNAARFLEMNEATPSADFDPASPRLTINTWIVSETQKLIADVASCLSDYRFNEAATAIYRHVWNTYCDWYLELIKPILMREDTAAKQETLNTAAWAFDQILFAAHPIMPFITQELYAGRGERTALLAQSAWPQLPVSLIDEDSSNEIAWVIDLISQIRSVRSEMNVPAGSKVPLVLLNAPERARSYVAEHQTSIMRIARLTSIAFEAEAPKGSAQGVVGDTTFCLPLGDVIDFKAEAARLDKDLGKLDAEISTLSGRLANEGFMAKAPEKVINELRDRLVEIKETKEKIAQAKQRIADFS